MAQASTCTSAQGIPLHSSCPGIDRVLTLPPGQSEAVQLQFKSKCPFIKKQPGRKDEFLLDMRRPWGSRTWSSSPIPFPLGFMCKSPSSKGDSPWQEAAQAGRAGADGSMTCTSCPHVPPDGHTRGSHPFLQDSIPAQRPSGFLAQNATKGSMLHR